ncbi:MAG: hypothetical protein J7L73_03785 [Anaerolineales bacterium]|nr:hypothetical protein [Anaerolineales bacterium]
MEPEKINETQPIPVNDSTQDIKPMNQTQETNLGEVPPTEDGLSLKKTLILGLIILVLVIGISAFLGYQRGIGQRTEFEATQAAQAIQEQYKLGLEDIKAGRYEIARQRFDYVIQSDPSYPGVTDKLAEVLLILNATATPTPAPTATPIPITPTPDLRGEEELFAQAEDLLKNKEWTDAIETLESLRKKNQGYKTVKIDGMLYLALRNRGIQQIGLGNLEGGIYDLTLAEGFGPLDTEANNWRTWARYYITGASFWEIDWEQAVYYFEQVAPMTPNMHDGTGWTASQRYLEALLNYASWLEDQKRWCDAEVIYTKAYEYSGDSSLEEVIEIVADKCR